MDLFLGTQEECWREIHVGPEFVGSIWIQFDLVIICILCWIGTRHR